MSKEDGKRWNLIEVFGRYKYVILVAGLGALLLLWPWQKEDSGKEPITQTASHYDDIHDLELRMEEILSKMSGVGRVDVMLTVESGGELVLASDNTLRYSGSPQNPNDYDRSSETVTVSGGNGTEVVVTQERSPKYRGALIVCDGGDNDKVRLKIIEAVTALTGLGSDRVAVVRWGSEQQTINSSSSMGEDLS